MIRRNCLLTALVVLVGIQGCAGSPVQTGWEAEENREKMVNLKIGMSKAQVMAAMGRPRKTESYQIEGQNLEFWLYLTEGRTPYESLSDKHFTPLAFTDGKLVGWGRNYYERVLKLKHDITVEQK
jgi:outer membrane protein assembly factor BamE (lipoprotein component of BamABCDE complex)